MRYPEALVERYQTTGREVSLVLDNRPAHTSKQSRATLAERADGLHIVWIAL